MMVAESIQPGWSLAELLLDFGSVSSGEDVTVSGLAMDSRLVNPGDLFLACAGKDHHGLQFVEAALQAGAVAVAWEPTSAYADKSAVSSTKGVPVLPVNALGANVGFIADRFHGHPSRDLSVVGVAGTDGKTSCAHFIAQLLSEKQQSCGLMGTLGNGLYGHLENATHTTPDAVSLQSMLAEFRDQGLACVAMEVSSHALDQGRVAGVRFDVALFTNLGRDHLDYHGNIENYGRAKRRLFESVGLRAVVVNTDDPFSREILSVLSDEVEVVTYGLGAIPDWMHKRPGLFRVQGGAPEFSATGIRLTVDTSWGSGKIESSLLGEFNASNLLGALGVALVSGLSLTDCLGRLRSIEAVPGRMECFRGDVGLPLVVVDYAHTPQALEHALSALKEICRGSLWCVFGAGGDRDQGKRALMGASAERIADHVILTDDNPRSEDPQKIVIEIQRGMAEPDAVLVEHDRGTAIRQAIRSAAGQDIVLIAGKGHEVIQEVNGQRLPFDDRSKVAALVKGRLP